jgi:integrase
MSTLAPFSKQPINLSAIFMSMAAEKGRKTLTNERAKSTFNSLENFATSQRWRDQGGKPMTPRTITENQMRKFAQHRVSEGKNPRTIQTDMAIIRRSLHAAGRNEFADITCSNANLGVPVGTRLGKGTVVDPVVYSSALEKADANTRAMAVAMRTLGLRIKECVDCGPSLRSWERDLKEGRATITVSRSTKADKTRYTFIPPEKRAEALRAVQALKERYVANDKRIVPSKTFEAACRQASRLFAKVGLSGKNCSHSLRRGFCEERVAYYMSEGYSLKEAWGKTSIDVGHSDKRGRWLYNNYLRASAEAAAAGEAA